jgi:hypothetical protein
MFVSDYYPVESCRVDPYLGHTLLGLLARETAINEQAHSAGFYKGAISFTTGRKD